MLCSTTGRISVGPCAGLPSAMLCHPTKCAVYNARPLTDVAKPHTRGRASICPSMSVDKKTLHPGMFGDWRVDDNDIAEVYGYRIGISVAAVSALAVCSTMLLDPAHTTVHKDLLNGICITGTAGFGVSIVLIHIYVSEIKRTIQALWAWGFFGGLWLMSEHADVSLPVFVLEHGWALWLVGPAFAAITAVAIKEGLCYGKAEAAVLALITPLWLMGHLTGIVPRDIESVMAVAFTATFALFAARKYSQQIKDDIGDKSVFTFRALPEAEQEVLLRQMEAAKQNDNTY